MTVTNRNQTMNLSEEFDVEEMALLESCLAKIKRHVERNLEAATDQEQVSRLMNFRWHMNKNFQ